MSEDLVQFEVDGQILEARPGSMLIEATDAAGIYIPRFCYHKKLSIAANCRMCLVEVERAPKPMPACATPVMAGMKVFTRSDVAVRAQRATMEFLLINHPLDCPICDQGGECELQDLAMGYGDDISRFSEQKRVVTDKNIGPLIQTDMTRCIHCTRCVRFGEEIAGLRELGATGRGEDMEIGTYVESAMTSELSGNIIDLCPVGALTSKPYRYSARAWELQQRDSIAPHDCVGSNVHLHIKGRVVKRVVPRDNESVNETWLADRDRFSYEGLNSPARLLTPRIKTDGAWVDCDWPSALDHVCERLAAVIETDGAERIGALASPSSTTEELYLLQRLLRGLGSHNVDHRLRQCDFSDQGTAPIFPGLAMSFGDLEQADAVLLIGSHPRYDQPLVNQRLRKAAARGAAIMAIGSVGHDFNLELRTGIVVRPSAMPGTLAGIAAALIEQTGAQTDEQSQALLAARVASEQEQDIARCLAVAAKPVVLLGNAAQRHPNRSMLRSLGARIAHLAAGRFGQLTEGANAAGAWLAGCVPHRGPGRRDVDRCGHDAMAMLTDPLSAYVLLGVEPDLDCLDGARARQALHAAQFVVALSAFEQPSLGELCDVLLPVAAFAENEGSFVNAAGVWQSFAAAVPPPGEARPAWKVLRVLGGRFGLPGFDAVQCRDLSDETRALSAGLSAVDNGPWPLDGARLDASVEALERIVEIPMYAVDALVRNAAALNRTQRCGDDRLYVSAATLKRLRLTENGPADVTVNGTGATLIAAVDASVPDDSCLYFGARPATAAIGFDGPLQVKRVD